MCGLGGWGSVTTLGHGTTDGIPTTKQKEFGGLHWGAHRSACLPLPECLRVNLLHLVTDTEMLGSVLFSPEQIVHHAFVEPITREPVLFFLNGLSQLRSFYLALFFFFFLLFSSLLFFLFFLSYYANFKYLDRLSTNNIKMNFYYKEYKIHENRTVCQILLYPQLHLINY